MFPLQERSRNEACLRNHESDTVNGRPLIDLVAKINAIENIPSVEMPSIL